MRRAASNAALLLAFSVSAGAHQERKFGVVGVLSADGHAALRQAQRKTWIRGVREASAKDKGGGGAGVEVVFLLDRPTAATAREAAARGDVRFLNASFSGRANHFGEKLALWLRLARRWFPGAAFVAKVDDDAYVCAHAWDAVWARASPRMYLGWFHRHGSHRADEMFVVLGAELVDRLAARRYCGSAGTCDRARDLVDTGYAGTSLGIWLGAYRDVAEVDLRRAGLTNSARGNESCGAAQLIAHPVKDPAAVARLGARLGQRTRAEEEGLLDDHGDVPPPFDVADWFGGGCGRRLAGVTVVETRFMQGQGQFPELVAARLRQLLAVAVPSVVHQTNQCFVWVLLTDPKLPAAPRRSVAAALRAHPHARLVDYPVRTIREAPNVTLYEEVFGAAGWRQAMRNASELTLVRLDADDGLHVHYLQLLADWRARHRGELSAASTYAYACSSRSLDWKSASAKEWVASAPGETKRPSGVQLNVFYERHGRGCLASGLAMTHVVLDGMIPPCFPKPCTANHASLRAQRFPVKNIASVASGPVGWSAPPPVFRVRSVTSNGGSNRQGGRADVPPAALAASYGLDLRDLLALTRYLERHEAAVATEMLKSPAARGCNSQYSGSCDRASAVHWARDVTNRHSNIPRRPSE